MPEYDVTTPQVIPGAPVGQKVSITWVSGDIVYFKNASDFVGDETYDGQVDQASTTVQIPDSGLVVWSNSESTIQVEPVIQGSPAQLGGTLEQATGPVGNIVFKAPIYDQAGNLVGYAPIYESIT